MPSMRTSTPRQRALPHPVRPAPACRAPVPSSAPRAARRALLPPARPCCLACHRRVCLRAPRVPACRLRRVVGLAGLYCNTAQPCLFFFFCSLVTIHQGVLRHTPSQQAAHCLNTNFCIVTQPPSQSSAIQSRNHQTVLQHSFLQYNPSCNTI